MSASSILYGAYELDIGIGKLGNGLIRIVHVLNYDTYGEKYLRELNGTWVGELGSIMSELRFRDMIDQNDNFKFHINWDINSIKLFTSISNMKFLTDNFNNPHVVKIECYYELYSVLLDKDGMDIMLNVQGTNVDYDLLQQLHSISMIVTKDYFMGG